MRLMPLPSAAEAHIHQYLASFMQPTTWKDLAFMAVAKGPGSFTGTRIGVVTARTIAQQLEIPLFAISTLASVAWSEVGKSKNASPQRDFAESALSTCIALQMPAQRGQLFTAIYQASPAYSGLTQLLPDTVMTPQEWQQTLETQQTSYQLIDIPAGAGLGAAVSSLLELAYLDWQQGKSSHWSEALPFYGQHPVEPGAK